MIKRSIFAIVAIYIAWSILDYVIHGVLLVSTYDATAELWRPRDEMKMGLMYFVTFIIVLLFVTLYGCLVFPKTLGNGVKLGLKLGLIVGFGMGFGTYTYMPIPMNLAVAWFAGTLVEYIVAGAIVGALVKDQPKVVL